MRYLAIALALAACGPSQAEGDRVCASSQQCATRGKCWFDPDALTFGPKDGGVYTMSQRVVRSDRDCMASRFCRALGDCTFDEGRGVCTK